VIDLKSGREADGECRDVVAEAEAILVDALFDEIIRDLTGWDTVAGSLPLCVIELAPSVPRMTTGQAVARRRHRGGSIRSPPRPAPPGIPNLSFVGGVDDRDRSNAQQCA